MITSVKKPLTRKYRKILISTAFSGMILGVATWSMPLILRKVNPIQSKKIPLEKLPITAWEEPIENPVTNLESPDEMAWLKRIPEERKLRFKFKLKLDLDFKNMIAAEEKMFMYKDQDGNLRGFDPYTGLNHWVIRAKIGKILDQVISQKRLYLLDTLNQDEDIRVSCIDLQTPSILWQRIIPEGKDASAIFDFETQSLVVSTLSDGIWSLKSKTGEILWKKPELFTKTRVLHSGRNLLAFEPPVGKNVGSWYLIDSLTGKTNQKQPHVYPDMENFIPFSFSESFQALAKVDSKQYFLLNPVDMSVVWSQFTTEPILKISVIDEQTYLIAYRDNLLEKRNLKSGDLIWQKKMNQADLSTLKIDPKQRLIIAANSSNEESPGIAFFDLEEGSYLYSVELPEPPLEAEFFGDWLYFMSESFVWAFQHETGTR